ncbi:MAG: cyclodeaminase/cyclohydrolase family protein [Candidatus Omnitrophota bacterium]|jgi:formiminotetrahydrofolate cyclodeaminase
MKKGRHLKGSVDKYLKGLSSRTITPGGGSASALTAALGVSLNLMVINYTKKSDRINKAKARQRKSLNELSALIDDDCKAFDVLMRALSSGRSAQKEYRTAAFVPLKICRQCYVSLGITEFLSKQGNKNLMTDVGCAADILRAAFNSARLNVKINLKEVKDKDFAQRSEKDLSDMRKNIKARYTKIYEKVNKATGKR